MIPTYMATMSLHYETKTSFIKFKFISLFQFVSMVKKEVVCCYTNACIFYQLNIDKQAPILIMHHALRAF